MNFHQKNKVMKDVMFCDYIYVLEQDTRKSVSGIVATLGGTLITYSSRTQRTVTLSCIEAEYVVISECAQEVRLVIR